MTKIHRWGRLGNENSLLQFLNDESSSVQPVTFTLHPANANLYARRHSAHNCSPSEQVTPVSIK